MGSNIYPAPASGGGGGGLTSAIKSIQRGSAGSSGNITISSVNITKTIVNSFSNGSAGTVAASGTVNAANGSTSGVSFSGMSGSGGIYVANAVVNTGGTIPVVGPSTYTTYSARYGTYYSVSPAYPIYMSNNGMNTNGANIGLNATSITGGTTDLATKSYGAYLVDATTIYATGPCRYEVIEYY